MVVNQWPFFISLFMFPCGMHHPYEARHSPFIMDCMFTLKINSPEWRGTMDNSHDQLVIPGSQTFSTINVFGFGAACIKWYLIGKNRKVFPPGILNPESSAYTGSKAKRAPDMSERLRHPQVGFGDPPRRHRRPDLCDPPGPFATPTVRPRSLLVRGTCHN